MLAELAIEGSLSIRPQKIFLSGDKLTAAMEQTIQEAWGAPIYVLYSASESLFIAARQPGQSDMVVMNDLNILEVLADDNRPVPPGAAGRVVLTNLYNFTLPIIRYELGDHVMLGPNAPGVSSTTIRDISGRSSDALPVILDDGACDSISHHVLGEFYVPGIEKFQFISRRPDSVRINYVARHDLDSAIRKEFHRILQMKCALRTTFEVRRVKQIHNDPRTGKFAVVKLEKEQRASEAIVDERSQPALAVSARNEDAPGPVSDTNRFDASIGEWKTQNAIVAKCHHTSGAFVEFQKDEIERSITERFERIAALYAGRPAVKTKESTLTYSELNKAANRLARAILAKRGTGQEPAVVLVDADEKAIIAVLGVLKAGKICVPLDSSNPPGRLQHVLEATEARLIVTSHKNVSLANGALRGGQLIDIDELDPELSNENLGLSISPRDLAYILYTSGSSGQPKSVMHDHRDLLHSVMASGNPCRYGPEDRMILFASSSSAHGGMMIFSALLYGASLYLWNIKERGVADLSRWLRTEEITIYISSPTVFRSFAATLSGRENFPKLRLIRLGSEPLKKIDIEFYQKHFSPQCVLVQILASAEAMHVANYFIDKETDIGERAVPVGYPVEGKTVLILNDDGREMGRGEVGEIAVKSDYLFPGYWRETDLTQSVLLPDPAGGRERIYRTGDLGRVSSDGCLTCIGRKDSRVKVRGYGVDLAEIETALLEYPAASEVVVVAADDANRETRLIAYVVLKNGGSPEITAALRKFLASKFPDYMIPADFMILDSLPVNPNGKVDRKALPSLDVGRRELGEPFVAPETETEKLISEVWKEVLQLEKVGIHDSFLELGGHSLDAVRVMSRIFNVFGVHLSLDVFFASPTVAGIAEAINKIERDSWDVGDAAEGLAPRGKFSEEQREGPPASAKKRS